MKAVTGIKTEAVTNFSDQRRQGHEKYKYQETDGVVIDCSIGAYRRSRAGLRFGKLGAGARNGKPGRWNSAGRRRCGGAGQMD
jgi:hypothetical protein